MSTPSPPIQSALGIVREDVVDKLSCLIRGIQNSSLSFLPSSCSVVSKTHQQSVKQLLKNLEFQFWAHGCDAFAFTFLFSMNCAVSLI